MSRRAAIYARISQARDGSLLGVDRQLPPCEQLCTQRGWAVIPDPDTGQPAWVDNDLSASRFANKPRPAYERMLQAARDGDVTAIVVLDSDRLTRRPIENETVITLSEQHGIALATTAGEIDLGTASGRLQFRLLGSVAAHESELKSERVRRRMEQKALAGEDHGGIRAFGRLPDRAGLHPVEAPLLEAAARDLLAGHTLKGVVGKWNADGILTTRGRPWGASSLRRLLLNPRVYGARVHNGRVVVADAFPPILDRHTFEQVHALLTDPSRRKGAPARYLLTGIVSCWRCHQGLVGDQQRGRPSYGCRALRRGCGRITVSAQPLEERIVGAVLERLSGEGYARAKAALAADDPTWSRLVSQQQQDETALAELAHARFTERTIGHREYLAEFATLTARIDHARAAAARRVRVGALTEAGRHPGGIRAWWVDPDTTLDMQRAVIMAVCERIVVGPGRPHQFDKARVLPPYGPTWRV